jgi:hypothetical protein
MFGLRTGAAASIQNRRLRQRAKSDDFLAKRLAGVEGLFAYPGRTGSLFYIAAHFPRLPP